jgi:hypothetical protein
VIEASTTEPKVFRRPLPTRALALRIWSMVRRELRVIDRGPRTRHPKHIEHLPPPDSFYSRLNPEVMRIDVRRLR